MLSLPAPRRIEPPESPKSPKSPAPSLPIIKSAIPADAALLTSKDPAVRVLQLPSPTKPTPSVDIADMGGGGFMTELPPPE